jgi:isopenicillin N synthase-like dioxygenase
MSGPDHPGRGDALVKVREALQNRGYFYASGVNVIPAQYISKVYDYSRRLHSLPADTKRSFVPPTGSYYGPDVGDGNEEYAYEAGTTSSVRAWEYSRMGESASKVHTCPIFIEYVWWCVALLYTGLTAGNSNERYPGCDVIEPLFVDVLDELYEKQDALGTALMVAFAEMLGESIVHDYCCPPSSPSQPSTSLAPPSLLLNSLSTPPYSLLYLLTHLLFSSLPFAFLLP